MPIPPLSLTQDDEVLEFREDGRARREDLGQMAPIHADVVDRSLDTVRGQRRERLLQKRGECLAAHLPSGHSELPVFDAAQAAGMPVDRDVVGRIGEDQAGLLARHQGGEHGRVAHIATDQPVRPELPDLAPADPGGGGIREDVVGRVIRLLGATVARRASTSGIEKPVIPTSRSRSWARSAPRPAASRSSSQSALSASLLSART